MILLRNTRRCSISEYRKIPKYSGFPYAPRSERTEDKMAKKFGRGISELLANVEDARIDAVSGGADKIYSIPIKDVAANPDQPRKHFDEAALRDLASSISEHGIIQPLVVRRRGDKYIIVAGERRYRAAIMAGLSELPVVVREFSDQSSREISLIENLQREDLNAIEAAEAMKELMESYRLTQEELAKRIGKARPSITNTLRLLMLDVEVQDLVRQGKLSAGHARTLIPVTNVEHQKNFAYDAIDRQISVRELEKKIRFYLSPETAPKKESIGNVITREMKSYIDDMKKSLSAKVRISGNEQKGKISIEYGSKDELLRIYEYIKNK